MSGMIRRLRWKIVGISMLFVTLVLAAVFTGVMLTARSSLEQSSTRQLEKALRGEGYDGQNGQPCFVTEVYSSGTVRVMGSSYYQISEEDLLALVQECLSQQEESGLLTEEFAASRNACVPTARTWVAGRPASFSWKRLSAASAFSCISGVRAPFLSKPAAMRMVSFQ